MDIESLIGANNLRLIIKAFLLSIILLYAIFSYIVYTKLKSLSKVVFIKTNNVSNTLNTIAFVYFILTVSLFFIALVIL